jgi:hypothetical protein
MEERVNFPSSPDEIRNRRAKKKNNELILTHFHSSALDYRSERQGIKSVK